MKYLIILLTAVLIAALFVQIRAWEGRRAFYTDQLAHLSQTLIEKKRAAKLEIMLPEEKSRLAVEIDSLREQTYEYHRLIIKELRTKPFDLPLNGNEQNALAEARVKMEAIEKEKQDEGRQRMRDAAEAEARRRAAVERLATPPPKPGDWMWRERPVTSMERSYR